MIALLISCHNPDPLTLTICSVGWVSLKDHFLEPYGALIVLQNDSSCFILYLSRCFYLLLSRMTQSHVLHSILWIPVWLKHCAACIVQRFYRTVVPIVESALALQNDSPLLRVPCLYQMTALFITFHNPDPLTFPFCSVLMGVPERSIFGALIVLQNDSSCFIVYLSRCFYLLLSRMTQSHVLQSILWIYWIPLWLKHCAACIVQKFYRTVVPIVESALALQNDSSLHLFIIKTRLRFPFVLSDGRPWKIIFGSPYCSTKW